MEVDDTSDNIYLELLELFEFDQEIVEDDPISLNSIGFI